MNTFGDVVHALRKQARMTLEVAARKIGTHKGYISGIEGRKVNPPSVGIVRKFARLFKVDEQDLVELAVVSKSPPFVRARLMARLADNPLAVASIVRGADVISIAIPVQAAALVPPADPGLSRTAV